MYNFPLVVVNYNNDEADLVNYTFINVEKSGNSCLDVKIADSRFILIVPMNKLTIVSL